MFVVLMHQIIQYNQQKNQHPAQRGKTNLRQQKK
jgi:hypothetical protein